MDAEHAKKSIQSGISAQSGQLPESGKADNSTTNSLRNGLPPKVQRLVVKVGSRVLVDQQGRPDPDRISQLTMQVAELHKKNYEVIFVSSGAIAAGVQILGWQQRPANLPDLQMAAAIGQGVLLSHYIERFTAYGCRLGQVLLTHGDLNDRIRHLNARNTIMTMLRNRIIPVVNENDVVAVDEIRFGDNDLLAAMVATLIDADLLILLTTSDGLYRNENKQLVERIPRLEDITDETISMAQGKGSGWSSGGMASKLQAAGRAIKAGTPVVIANGHQEHVLDRLLRGEDLGTLIVGTSRQQKLKARKKWIAFFHRPQGSVIIDEGASRAICDRGFSLLPVGVLRTEGRFRAGSLVNIRNNDGEIIARGLTAYDRDDIELIKGKRSSEIPAVLGDRLYAEVIHRDNMVLI
ncbi:MAG: glutamate 5-kinase [Balneolales bacterium]